MDEMRRGYVTTVLAIIIPSIECPDETPFATDRRLIAKWNYAMNRLALHPAPLGG
jgi:hypothetical protein